MNPAATPCTPAEGVKATKSLRFTTTTTYLFHPALGGSALPAETGPAVGLAPRHFDELVADIPSSKWCRRGRVRKFTHHERIDLLKAAGLAVKDIAAYCSEAIDIRQSRAATRIEEKQKRQIEAKTDSIECAKRRRVVESV